MTKKDSTPAPRKRGRPKKELNIEQIREDLRNGLNKEDCYKEQGLNVSYGGEREREDEELARAVREGQEEFKDRYADAIKPLLTSAYRQKVLDGDVAAILYGMRNIVGFTEKRALEVNGEVTHIHTLDPAQRAERIKQLRAELETEIVDVAIEESTDDSK